MTSCGRSKIVINTRGLHGWSPKYGFSHFLTIAIALRCQLLVAVVDLGATAAVAAAKNGAQNATPNNNQKNCNQWGG